MIRILVAPTDEWACDLYRCSGPHKKLQEIDPEFQCDIDYKVDFKNIDRLSTYDIIQLHAGIYPNHFDVINALIALKGKVVTILDFDDFWEIPEGHEGYSALKELSFKERCLQMLLYVDYVTCTQDYFNKKLSKYHKNVITIPNAIDTTIQYTKTPSDKVRFGFVGGRSHIHDYMQLQNVTASLPKAVLDRCQFVVCGFNPNRVVDEKGNVIKTCVLDNNAYYQYEKVITSDYSIVSPQYKQWLLTFQEEHFFPEEPYYRKWSKPIDQYMDLYKDIDVVIAPLLPCEFNSCKSNLKFLEAGVTNTALIATNTGPYATSGIDLLENPSGNCRLVEPNKSNWTLAIQHMVLDNRFVEVSKKNLSNYVKQFDLTEITKNRDKIYRKMLETKNPGQ